jgi:glycosyltransferase involved in cell wall biosynthesis
VAILARAVPEIILLVGTLSDAAPLWRAASQAGVATRLRVHALDTDAARRTLHAAADVMVVPRRSAGGLPIKLLDAMSRGVACVVTPTAAAGLPLQRAVATTDDDLAPAIAASLRLISSQKERSRQLGSSARDYVSTHHNPNVFLQAFDQASAKAMFG